MASDSSDYADFRSFELGEKIGEVLSLSGRASLMIRALVLVTLACAGLAWLVLLADAAWLRVLATGYGGVVGVVVGIGAAILWLAQTELRRIEELLLLILDVAARVAKARANEDPGSRPKPSELLPVVYKKVVSPMVTQIVRKQLRLLGRPAAWILDALLERGVKMLAKLLEVTGVGWEWFERDKPAAAPEPAPELALEAASEPGPEAESEPALEAAPEPEPEAKSEPPSENAETRELVQQVGGRLRRLLVPFWIALVVGAMLGLSPVVAVAWFAG